MKIHYIVPVIFLCLLVSGCGSKSTVSSSSLAPSKYQKQHTKKVRARLLDHYLEWQGVPHCQSGMSKDGIDSCSFAYLTYREKFDIRLPKSTSQLANIGKQISKIELQPGDLVFFKVDMGNRHVGIYVDDHKFIHASKNKGVEMSSLSNPYWQKCYWQARRIASL